MCANVCVCVCVDVCVCSRACECVRMHVCASACVFCPLLWQCCLRNGSGGSQRSGSLSNAGGNTHRSSLHWEQPMQRNVAQCVCECECACVCARVRMCFRACEWVRMRVCASARLCVRAFAFSLAVKACPAQWELWLAAVRFSPTLGWWRPSVSLALGVPCAKGAVVGSILCAKVRVRVCLQQVRVASR